ncbi:MAG: hypothetical protein ACRECO_17320 [Xanthobacteraceae bacterium]
MAKDYRELVSFAKEHASNPVALAKILTAWQYTSLLPGGVGSEPTSAEDVPHELNASCGWRDILLKALFAEIGIEGRRVNFYEVPFQGGHTATELKINGKWMFFDPTFGTYFERKGGGGNPLSVEEIRADWPNVVAKQCTLIGWQGVFVDPDTVSATAFAKMSDTYFFQPTGYAHRPDVISGEINSLYIGPDSAYYINNRNTPINAGDRDWIDRRDAADTRDWSRIVDGYDAGRLDTRFGLFDNGNRWFVDWDQGRKFSWDSITRYVTVNAVTDYVQTVNDNRSYYVDDRDQASQETWSSKTSYFTRTKLLDQQSGVFDNGSTWVFDWDRVSAFTWKSYTLNFSSGGALTSTSFEFDNGTNGMVSWDSIRYATSSSRNVVGTGGRDALIGTGGNNELVGLAGADLMKGGRGNDVYYVDDADDIILELLHEGTDAVWTSFSYVLPDHFENLVLLDAVVYGNGNSSDNIIMGNAGRNILSGHAGNDKLYGQGGNDLLSGSFGNDILIGGRGSDKLYGQGGADIFYFSSIGDLGIRDISTDRIFDFSQARNNKIHLSKIDADVTKSGNQAFDFIGTAKFSDPGQIRWFTGGGDTRIILNTDNDAAFEALIIVSGRHKPDAAWFVL